MARVWSFLGVDIQRAELPGALEVELGSNPDKDWQQEKAGELVEPLQKGKSGSWRDLFTDRDRTIFRKIAGQTLVDWRYEKGLEW